MYAPHRHLPKNMINDDESAEIYNNDSFTFSNDQTYSEIDTDRYYGTALYQDQPKYHPLQLPDLFGIRPYIQLVNSNIHLYNANIISHKMLARHLSKEYARIYNYTHAANSEISAAINDFFTHNDPIYYGDVIAVVRKKLRLYAASLRSMFDEISRYLRALEDALTAQAWLIIRAIWLLHHHYDLGGRPRFSSSSSPSHDMTEYVEEAGEAIVADFLERIR